MIPETSAAGNPAFFDDVKIFYFDFSESSYQNIGKGREAIVTKKHNRIKVRIENHGTTVIYDDGQAFKTAYEGSIWNIEKDALRLRIDKFGNNGTYTFSLSGFTAGYVSSEHIRLESKPVDKSAFIEEYNSLRSYLEKNGILKEKNEKSGKTTATAPEFKPSNKMPRPEVRDDLIEEIPLSQLKNKANQRSATGKGLRYDGLGGHTKFTLEQMIKNPLGYYWLDWNDTDIELMGKLAGADVGFEALYKQESYSMSFTYIDLFTEYSLPEEFDFNGSRVIMSTRYFRPSVVYSYRNDEAQKPSVHLVFSVTYPDGSKNSFEYEEKNLNKVLEKYFKSLVDELKAAGYTITKDGKYNYNIVFSNDLEGQITLELSKHHACDYSRIIVRFKPAN